MKSKKKLKGESGFGDISRKSIQSEYCTSQRSVAEGVKNGTHTDTAGSQRKGLSAPSALERTRSFTGKGESDNPRNGKLHVHFELDSKKRVARRVNFVRNIAHKYADALWWSDRELDLIHHRENRVYESCHSSSNYLKNVRQLWSTCAKASCKPFSTRRIQNVAGARSRGLEVDVIECVRDRRLKVIQSILTAQENLKLNDIDPMIQEKVLSARYKNMSRTATRFAQKMAEGDELEAARVYSEL